MSGKKTSPFFKLVSFTLIITFTVLQIAWAYPGGPSTSTTLSGQAIFQQQMMTEKAQLFRESILSDGQILGTAIDICNYLLGEPENDIEPLPIEHLESAMQKTWGLRLPSGFNLTQVVNREGVILIPYNAADGKKSIIQITLKKDRPKKDIAGYEWVVSDKYIVKVLPEAYAEQGTSRGGAVAQKEPEVTVTEPIAQVIADKDTAKPSGETAQVPKVRSYNVRAVLTRALGIMLLFTAAAFAGTESAAPQIGASLFHTVWFTIFATASILSAILVLAYGVFPCIENICDYAKSKMPHRYFEPVTAENMAVVKEIARTTDQTPDKVLDDLRGIAARNKSGIYDRLITEDWGLSGLDDYDPLMQNLDLVAAFTAGAKMKELRKTAKLTINHEIMLLVRALSEKGLITTENYTEVLKLIEETGHRESVSLAGFLNYLNPLFGAYWDTWESDNELHRMLKTNIVLDLIKMGAINREAVSETTAFFLKIRKSGAIYTGKEWMGGSFEVNNYARLKHPYRELAAYVRGISRGRIDKAFLYPNLLPVIAKAAGKNTRAAFAELLEKAPELSPDIWEHQVRTILVDIKNLPHKRMWEWNKEHPVVTHIRSLERDERQKSMDKARELSAEVRKAFFENGIKAVPAEKISELEAMSKSPYDEIQGIALTTLLAIGHEPGEQVKRLKNLREMMKDWLSDIRADYSYNVMRGFDLTLKRAEEALTAYYSSAAPAKDSEKDKIEKAKKRLLDALENNPDLEVKTIASVELLAFGHRTDELIEKLKELWIMARDIGISPMLPERDRLEFRLLFTRRTSSPSAGQRAEEQHKKADISGRLAVELLGEYEFPHLRGLLQAKALPSCPETNDIRALLGTLEKASGDDVTKARTHAALLEKGYKPREQVSALINLIRLMEYNIADPDIRHPYSPEVIEQFKQAKAIATKALTNYRPAATIKEQATEEMIDETVLRLKNLLQATSDYEAEAFIYAELLALGHGSKEIIKELRRLQHTAYGVYVEPLSPSGESEKARRVGDIATNALDEYEFLYLAQETDQPEPTEVPAETEEPDQTAVEVPVAQDEVKQLFEEVEATTNNRRARIENAGNEIVDHLKNRNEAYLHLREIDRNKTTAEMKKDLEAALEALNASTSELEDDLKYIEADSIIASIIALARSAKKQGQTLIIGLETGWIPGYDKGCLQQGAINPLIKEIESLGKILKDLGLDNVVLISAEGSALANTLLDEAESSNTDLSNVVVLASSDTVNSADFTPLRSTRTEMKAFLAGIDPLELEEFYEANGEAVDKQLSIGLLQMLSITLELASGKPAPDLPLINSYDPELRIVIFLPRAEPVNYQDLLIKYRNEMKALVAA